MFLFLELLFIIKILENIQNIFFNVLFGYEFFHCWRSIGAHEKIMILTTNSSPVESLLLVLPDKPADVSGYGIS